MFKKATRHIRHLKLTLRAWLRRVLVAVFSNERYSRWFYRIGGTALLARVASWCIKPGRWQANVPAVLCIERNLFAKDIEQLRRHTSGLNWPTIRVTPFGRMQHLWVSDKLRRQTHYASELNDKAWSESERFALKLLTLARKRFAIAAVMSSNIDYWQDEGLRRACRQIGIPFLVLMKEHPTQNKVYENSLLYYKNLNFRYAGTAAAVFGERTRQMLVESGACAPSQVWVTGAPRLDPWRAASENCEQRDSLTLLSYADPTYLAPNNFAEVLAIFAEASLRHQNQALRFVVKCKNSADRVRISEMIGAQAHNLEISEQIRLTSLLPRSRLVIGYNSLAMLEALFSSAVLAVPQWGDARRSSAEQTIDPTDFESRAIYNFPETGEVLRHLIDRATMVGDQPTDRNRRLKLLDKYFRICPAETSSQLVERFVLNFISPSSQRDAA